MKWFSVEWLVGLAIATFPAAAQQPSMNQWLNAGSEQERVQKFASLGIKEDRAKLAAHNKVQWQPIRSQHEYAVLFVPCGAMDSAFLYLLDRTHDAWHVTDSRDFDCHYDGSVSFEAVPLRHQNVDDVLVHHECEGHGTGFLQQDFNVFVVRSRKFKRALDTEELLEISGWPGATERLQRSMFSVGPVRKSGSRTIEETRCLRLNGTLYVEKRHFKWNTSASRFAPSTFTNVAPSDAATMAFCSKLLSSD